MMYIHEQVIACDQGAVRSVRFSADGNYSITCGSDKTLKLWNPVKNLFLQKYAGHSNDVLTTCGSGDNSSIVSGGADKTIILWDVVNARPIRRFHEHVRSVTSVLFNELSTVIISASQDNTVMCWDSRSRDRKPIQVFREANKAVTQIQVVNHEIITASMDNKLRIYDIRSGKLYEDLLKDSLISISLTSDEQCILVSCADNVMRLLDKKTGSMLGKYCDHNTGDFYIENAVDNKDNFVFSGSTTGDIWCWDLVTMQVLSKFIHNAGRVVNSIAYHPAEQCFLSASDNTVKYWSKQLTL